jgi:ABC-type glutathione transport system ATPase component
MSRAEQPLLSVRGLAKSYVQRRAFSNERYRVRAFAEVDLMVSRGETLAIVGESGAGKSSLGRCLALLERPESGEIRFEGEEISRLTAKELFALRRKIQFIFQEPTAALNPRFTTEEIIAEPLRIQQMVTKSKRLERARELMRQVGLAPEWAGKTPLEFSGGQRQRLAIARALALEPKLLILDEVLAGLDLANQEMILRLLAELQASYSLTYIHISHDLRMVAESADTAAVMFEGKIVEQGHARELFARPQHAYTRELIRAMPLLEGILAERFRGEVA